MSKTKKVISLIFVIFLLMSTSIVAFADTNVYTNEDVNDLFSITAGDIFDINSLIRSRETFNAIIEDDGKYYTYINAPTITANFLYNGLEETFSSQGYDNTTIIKDMDKYTEGSWYETNKNGNTAASVYGFNLPIPIYNGEWPIIKFDATVLAPDGFWEGVKNVLSFLTGGSITSVQTEDIKNFYYINNDYYSDYYQIKWISENWDNACAYIESEDPDIPILSKTYTGNENGEIDGVYYTYNSVIASNGLSRVSGSANSFNQRLKRKLGDLYDEVLLNVSELYGVPYTTYPLRFMPYETETLISDSTTLVQDPRADINCILFVHNNFDLLKNSGLSVKITGFINSFALVIDNIFSYDFFDEVIGVDIINGNSNIIELLSGLFAFLCLGKIVSIAYKGLKTGEHVKTAFYSLFVIFSGLFFIGMFNNERLNDTFKTIIETPERIETSIINNDSSFCSSSATDDEKYEMIYWLPYAETYSKFVTNHSLDECEDFTEINTELTELPDDFYPTIGGTEVQNWALIAMDSTVNRNTIDHKIYRMVDHFIAPKLDGWDTDNVTVSTSINPNYNGSLNSTSTWSSVFMSVLVLIQTFLKSFFFLALITNWVLLFIFIVRDVAMTKDMSLFMREAKTFGLSIVLYFIICILHALVLGFVIDAIGSEFIVVVSYSVVVIIFIAAEIIAIIKLRPRMLRLTR